MTAVVDFINKVADYVINPIIIFGFVVATIYLFWGIIELISKADGGDLERARRNVIYGVIGMFVMFSVYGIIQIVRDTFGF